MTNGYIIKDAPKKIKQYPDFLLKDKFEETDIYHVIDAKYKLKHNILNESDIRQLLTYGILFNKEFSQNLANQKEIKKTIIYVEKSDINLNRINELQLNLERIDIEELTYSYGDNLFDSQIGFIGIKVF